MSSKLPVTLALAGALVAGTAALNAQATKTAARPPATAPSQAQRDDTLKDQIAYRLDTNATVKKYDVKVKVENGMATLTGTVATAAQKAEAERLAKVNGITAVHNEIKVDPNEDKTLAERAKSGLAKTGEAITDAWITTKVKWFFIGEDLLKGSNIDVDTNGKVVTLKGTVKSAAGKARAEQLAKDTDGVTRVVNQLTIGG